MNFYPFHIGDYAAHTRNLSLLEDLAYRRLLDAYYLAEHPFNGSPTDVAREIGMRDQVAEVEYILNKFFVRDGNLWNQCRADKEIAKYHGKRENASKAGRASAQQRTNVRSTDVENEATPVDILPNRRSTNQEPRTKNQEPIERGKTSRGSRLPQNFEPDLDFARSHGIQDPTAEFERFKDYWIAQPGQKGVKLDWVATWRNWCRNYTPPKGQPIHVSTPQPVQHQITAEVGTKDYYLQLGRSLGFAWNQSQSFSEYVKSVTELQKNVRH